jgi:hypothetical protein
VIIHDISLENKNFGAMDILLSTTCSYEDHNHLLVLVYKLFRRMVMDAFIQGRIQRGAGGLQAPPTAGASMEIWGG